MEAEQHQIGGDELAAVFESLSGDFRALHELAMSGEVDQAAVLRQFRVLAAQAGSNLLTALDAKAIAKPADEGPWLQVRRKRANCSCQGGRDYARSHQHDCPLARYMSIESRVGNVLYLGAEPDDEETGDVRADDGTDFANESIDFITSLVAQEEAFGMGGSSLAEQPEEEFLQRHVFLEAVARAGDAGRRRGGWLRPMFPGMIAAVKLPTLELGMRDGKRETCVTDLERADSLSFVTTLIPVCQRATSLLAGKLASALRAEATNSPRREAAIGAADEWRNARWYDEVTDGGVYADLLRRAREDDRQLSADKRSSGRWFYPVSDVCRLWPQYTERIETAYETERKRTEAEF